MATARCEVIMKVSNPEDLTFEKKKSDHKKKYEAQEKVGRGKKNKVHVDETRNRQNNHKISTPSTKCEQTLRV